jgi:ankyrin repeat protein
VTHQYGASTTLRNKAALTAEEEAAVNVTQCKNFLNKYSTAPELHRAAMVNDITRILRILDSAPTQVDSVDDSGSSALHMAAASGYAVACRALCEVRNPAAFSLTPSHASCFPTRASNHQSALSSLPQRGARPDLPDKAGRTPIQAAKEGRHAAAAATLTDAAARGWFPAPAATA